MPSTVTTRRLDQTAVVEVTGDLDLQAAPALAAAMAVARIEHRTIVIDLSQVEFIDSTGLRELLGQAGTTSAAGRRLLVVEPPGRVGRIFDLTETRERFAWLPRAPDAAVFEPLPHRVARHRTALAAIDEVLGAGDVDDVARLISDAVGDACAINRLEGDQVHPITFAHREKDTEALLRRHLMMPAPVQGSTVFRDVLGTGRPVFLGRGDPIQLLPVTERIERLRGLSAIACLPLGPPGTVRGLLGASRDRGSDPYDEEDRVFLQRAAQALSASRTFTAASSG